MNELFIVSLLSKGGFFVYPILLCSVVALAIFLKKFFLIQEKKVLPEFFLNKLQSYLSACEVSNAIALCKSNKSSFAKIALAILSNHNLSKVEIEKVAEDEGSRQIFILSQSNELLGSLSNISTLLGLLGTISGMITVFQVISTQTVVDPPSLAGGISEALYTTAFGLIVAIPTFIGYKFINNKVLEISNKLQTESDKLINELRKISEPK
ncbi:MotA/TolQ/ExbB proton channel family protein [bacterium]|jgi:biopolymer transport protein ExbB|nr:MotA/TolQ/ExbB proton channel family protein [bacterium]NSW81325.1 MotA/TolQ/ExbB proton channel family protein [bacterium]NSX01345.1 MotA/TolQ/ExbB proton channel family protein [Deltaproteobacteria bacterium TMED58]RZP16471.1 MAG: MotA/TolQ/ExbB proton channel family protein [Candidatus Dadabacteria bacterium]|tara:strand:+ start:4322 stop:4951 length:630 start_codon:yes stop_codon:yes gene_type:complete